MNIEECISFTYAIWDSELSLKIGKSTHHPIQRLHTLQTGNPNPLHLLAYSMLITEEKAHQILNRWHIRGEWFKVCAETLKIISQWCWVDAYILGCVRRKLILM